MNNTIYLDNAATTRLKPEVLDEMMPYMVDYYANASANYDIAKKASKAIGKARSEISDLINASSKEIYFTSGGTESDNWAINSVAEKYKNKGNHIVTSQIEHHAVLHTLEYLETKGFEVTYLPVDHNGQISIEDLKNALTDKTILITIMTANNEVGSLQPVREIGALARKNGIIFHTDAVQAFGHIPIDVKKMKIDILSASGHKIHGPKGVGILFIKDGIKLNPFMYGGAQEKGFRPGTYNTPGIVGIGKAAELCKAEISSNDIKKKRDYFINRIINEIPDTSINGGLKNRLPNNINICFKNVDSEALLVLLNESGVYASAGSACTTGETNPSHVLLALGLTVEEAAASIRFTISDFTTKGELDVTIEILKQNISLLRTKSKSK